jgi:hypothetical protein
MKLILVLVISIYCNSLFAQGKFADKHKYLIGKNYAGKLEVKDFDMYQGMHLTGNYFISCLASNHDSGETLIVIESVGKESNTIIDILEIQLLMNHDVALGSCDAKEKDPNLIAIIEISEGKQKAIKSWLFNHGKKHFEYYDQLNVSCFKY